MGLTVYGIASCGTVKKARKWLDERDITHTWVDFRKTPVSAEQVNGWVQALGAKAMRNTSGGAYRALTDAEKAGTESEWAARFAADPMLIKRPIIERDGVAVQVGFRGTDAEHEAKLLPA